MDTRKAMDPEQLNAIVSDELFWVCVPYVAEVVYSFQYPTLISYTKLKNNLQLGSVNTVKTILIFRECLLNLHR